jgi:hypothetical protein
VSLWTRLRRFLCPACLPASGGTERPAVTILARTGERLDRMLARMAEDDNPVLGPKPPRVPRRQQR